MNFIATGFFPPSKIVNDVPRKNKKREKKEHNDQRRDEGMGNGEEGDHQRTQTLSTF